MNRIIRVICILFGVVLFSCEKPEIHTHIQYTIENNTDENIYVGVGETIAGYELDSHFVFEYADPDIFLKRIEPGDTIMCRGVLRDYEKKIISIIAYKESTLDNNSINDIVENNSYDWLFNYSFCDIKEMSFKIVCN